MARLSIQIPFCMTSLHHLVGVLLLNCLRGTRSFASLSRRSWVQQQASSSYLAMNDLFWNRETSDRLSYSKESPPSKTAKIIALTDPGDPANEALAGSLENAQVLHIGIEGLERDELQDANVVFVSHPKAREPLAWVLKEIPSIEWVHTRSAGIDFVTSPELSAFTGKVTNAKGTFSSTLAEYTMMACSYLYV